MTDHQVTPVPTAELEVLRRDAARYLWLRKIYFTGGVATHHLGRCDTPSNLDAAIDAAIAASDFHDACIAGDFA